MPLWVPIAIVAAFAVGMLVEWVLLKALGELRHRG